MTEIEALLQIQAIPQKIWEQLSDADNEAIKISVQALVRENADGCMGCVFVDAEKWELPCTKCKRCCKDYWRAKRGNEDAE